MLNADRIQRAQERMRDQNIDAYLILTHDDYIYFLVRTGSSPGPLFPPRARPSWLLSWERRKRSGSLWVAAT